MQIFLKHLKTCTVEVDESSPMDKLFCVASLKLGIPTERFRLTFGGRPLEVCHDQTLSDYTIVQHSTLFVSLRPAAPIFVNRPYEIYIDVHLQVESDLLAVEEEDRTRKIKAHLSMTMEMVRKRAASVLGLMEFLKHDALVFKLPCGSNLPGGGNLVDICMMHQDADGKSAVHCPEICVRTPYHKPFIRIVERQVTKITKKRCAAERAAELEAKKTKLANDMSDALVTRLLSTLPHSDRYTRYAIRRLDNADPVYCFLEKRLQASLVKHRASLQNSNWQPAPKLIVESIEEVFNPRLIERYILELQHMTGLSRAGASPNIATENGIRLLPAERTNLNEFLFYHGAKLADIDEISQAGFDPRRAGQNAGNLFGHGTYFAENFSKAELYAGPAPFKKFSGQMCVFVARVAMGESLCTRVTMKDIKLPPLRLHSKHPYDSIWAAKKRSDGGCVDHREYIVYKEAQAYPAFRVWYRHTADCHCARCKT
eukprot:TRINITY_DN41274_c0_g1_i1.p1 TRINITY_DN41274_c0_g1~~TRINITY_DN41274_c0_g1_i1.p1  ORF type:complete len:484 (+),score=57.88 TRINITY_DN41274_c0_g1_i1:58-1509(+)